MCRVDVDEMPAKPMLDSEDDAQAQKHGYQPGQQHHVVVQPGLAENADSRSHTCGQKKCSEGEGERSGDEDCRASVRETGIWVWVRHSGRSARTPELFSVVDLMSHLDSAEDVAMAALSRSWRRLGRTQSVGGRSSGAGIAMFGIEVLSISGAVRASG